MNFASIFSSISSIFSTVGGIKTQQADVMKTALDVLSNTNSSNAQREQAIATVLVAEASSESWLTRMWRPIIMLMFGAMLLSYWFGYSPPNIHGPMSPIMAEIFDLLKIGIGGYIGGRTIEKIIGNIGVSSALKQFIEKKLI